jgi:hypothetical protein
MTEEELKRIESDPVLEEEYFRGPFYDDKVTCEVYRP